MLPTPLPDEPCSGCGAEADYYDDVIRTPFTQRTARLPLPSPSSSARSERSSGDESVRAVKLGLVSDADLRQVRS